MFWPGTLTQTQKTNEQTNQKNTKAARRVDNYPVDSYLSKTFCNCHVEFASACR